MTTIQPDYFTAYSSLKMTRDVQGILVAEFHNRGGPLTFTARDHTDFVDSWRSRARALTLVPSSAGREAYGLQNP